MEQILDLETDRENQTAGPSGRMHLGGNDLTVDAGRVVLDGTVVGYLYENGFLRSAREQTEDDEDPDTGQWRLVDDLEGCDFQGTTQDGLPLSLPGPSSPGPTGSLSYNGRDYQVMQGRISNAQHKILGEYYGGGRFVLRDARTNTERRSLDEGAVINFSFAGTASDGRDLSERYTRPLYRDQISYYENEIIRYFQDFDRLNQQQRDYVIESMRIWAASGILQIVRKKEGNAALGNVKHGAAGVTRVRTGMVDLDAEEFERDIDLCARFGPLAVITTRVPSYVEVRVNLVVSHEFGHQLQFCLSQAAQDRIDELYQARLARSIAKFPPPSAYDGGSELVHADQVMHREFISGYAKASVFEYWAESVAAFSFKESRKLLRQLDPGICSILEQVVFTPEKVMSAVLCEQILNLQASLRFGGEFGKYLLD